MKAFYLFLFLSPLFFEPLFGQSCSGGTFSSQAALDQFLIDNPTCVNVTTTIYIDGSNIDNLNALQNIQTITGDLAIELTLIEDVDELSNLTSISGLLGIADNNSLLDLDGLSNLVSANEIILISNPNLSSIEGLSQINVSTISGNEYTIQGNSNISICPNGWICNSINERISQGNSWLVVGNGDDCSSNINTQNGCNALPVTFESLSGRLTSKSTIDLVWNTSSEDNNSHFSVEYFSYFNEWVVVGTVYPNLSREYKFRHTQISSENMYRIVQYDFDGTSTYSSSRFRAQNHTSSG